jgi:hypothetical protein
MNFNHKGSLAERFIRFRSGILATQDNSTDLFNAFSIYVPSNCAVANVLGVSLATIEDQPVVVEVTLDNYRDVLTGDLLAQWSPIFNQDTNMDVILYVIVFYVPDGLGTDVFSDYLTVTASTIDYAPLTTAFNLLYALSYVKMMFSPRYDGTSPVGGYDDQNYYDMALALAGLCLVRQDISLCLVYNVIELPLGTPDTNACRVLSTPLADEIAAATALDVVIGGVANPRRNYFWGMLNLMQTINTWFMVHSEPVNLFPVIFAMWFMSRNDTGTYIGNKLSKIRLSGNSVKPMGVPSILNSLANENLPLAQAQLLDSKYVSYLISIADGTLNDSIVLRAASITGFPVIASMMSKWVDYYTSQQIAKMMTAQNTLGNPVLRNEKTYTRIQEMLLNNLQVFARIGRLEEIYLNMPAYANLPASATDIVVSQGWTAVFVDDLERVEISGTVSV